MAEYIDRERLINDGIEKGFCDWYDEIKYAPTADVVEIPKGMTRAEVEHRLNAKVCNDYVERSKIDKAIAEITNLNGYQEGIDTMNVGDDLMISWCKTLDILKEI